MGWQAGTAGHLYFTKGNSNDPYNTKTNLSESIVKVSSDLKTVIDFFTPGNDATLDHTDRDLGSGGFLMIGMPGTVLGAAGKDGRMFLVNRNGLGHFNPTKDQVYGEFPIGECFCMPSSYTNHVVSSGGTTVKVWPIETPTGGSPTLGIPQVSADLGKGNGDGGFFTTVSSNGDQNVIIWAVTRGSMNLVALEPVAGTAQVRTIQTWPAGKWDDPSLAGANSDAVPVVANGHVYVASYKELNIFGFIPPRNHP
jgi:hypothetical protein